MESALECYAMAVQCERKAEEAESERRRSILLGVAAAWRRLGDDLKAKERIVPLPPLKRST
jgi:hypothetical protein